MSAPFAEVAHNLRKRGLAVIPCPGDRGKSPEGAYAFRDWHRPPGQAFMDEMIARHGNDNAGIVTDLSRRKLSVVDVDDPGERGQIEAVRRFGDTPLATMTPSGGLHLWFRFSGEPSTDLRGREGLPIEIKTASSRLVVIVPPSYRRPAGDAYFLVQGGWADLERLPPIKPGALPSLEQARSERIQEGVRNRTLWEHCMRLAPHCDDLDALLDCARTFAEDTLDLTGRTHRVTDAEITCAAESAWGYQVSDRNMFGRGATVLLNHDEIDELLAESQDAFVLLAKLRRHHWGRDFALAKSMAATFAWGMPRFKAARDCLIRRGIIRRIHRGGRGPHDPSVYRWTRKGS